MPVLKEYINPSFNEFKQLLKKHYNDLNFKNIDFINELFNYVYVDKVKGVVDFKSKCNSFFKKKRNNKPVSKITVEYWLSRGYDIEYASKMISKLQTSRSPINESYWINKGYPESEASKLVSNEQSNRSKLRYEKYTKEEISTQSVWSVEYWISKGFSKEDALFKAYERNYGCREFWNSEEEYANIKKIIAKKQSEFIKNNPEVYKSFFGSISKEEVSFFNTICNEINNIKHNEFIVNIQKSLDLNQGIIKYDGYYKDGNTLILIEYDGLYWHNESYDEIKDKICLSIRNDITGIIRISDEQYKSNRKIIKHIQDAIEKIKSKECNRVKIY